MSIVDVISDKSGKNLEDVPSHVLEMYNLKMLYLEGNLIRQLPEDFFDKLRKLTWLDLRKNKLTTIPSGIAHHSFLETLLLQDNAIEELPNELGLVSSLKVLQVSGNPLKYPKKELIEQGVHSICEFLYQEYYKERETPSSEVEEDEERELSVVNPNRSSAHRQSGQKESVKNLALRSGKKSKTSSLLMPSIEVKSLTEVPSGDQYLKRKSLYSSKKTHRITRGYSKICLRSHALWNSKKKTEERMGENELKEIWLSRLRDLLADQEKILQQEKNLKALNKWRIEKKAEPPRNSLDKIPEVPYGTDAGCNKILSRKDITMQIDSMIKRSKKSNKKETSKKLNLQRMIDQVVEQMKHMETRLTAHSSPRAAQAIAAHQIESIVELHKKIMGLQAKNIDL